MNIPTPQESCILSGQRNMVAQDRHFKNDEDLALRYSQIALPFCPAAAGYLVVHLKNLDSLTLKRLRKIVAQLEKEAVDHGFTGLTVTCVSLELWKHWAEKEDLALDPKLFDGWTDLHNVLGANKPPYALDMGELFFHVKASKRKECEIIVNSILTQLGDATNLDETQCTFGDSMHGGRIFGGRMVHGIINSSDPVCFSTRAIIGNELPDHKGGCFALTQRFIHDWQQLNNMSDNDMENLIGRDHKGNVIPNDDKCTHIKMVRVNDKDGLNFRHIPQGQPFQVRSRIIPLEDDERDQEHSALRYRLEDLPKRDSVGRGKEEGLFQISYTKTIPALTIVLQNMIGYEKGYIRSRHLNFSHADSGNYWYVPSAKELGRHSPHKRLTVPMNAFFDTRSDNGYMFYNSKDYIHHLGNRTKKAKNLAPLPSDRIVELLGHTFSRWHDTWYARRPAPELGHLEEYLAIDALELNGMSLAVRKGLATKITLELLSASGLGNEFDTFRLHPSELIVGAVPEFTLGSGFEAMRYLTSEEQQSAFVMGLNESGAAGHNVPNYTRLVRDGIGKVLEQIKQGIERSSVESDIEAKDFYESCQLALEGVQAYLKNYAALAREKYSALPESCVVDRQNLLAISTRLELLATEPPSTFLDAAQLVYSMHCCMHIAGESVSIGRLDQILNPFYEKELAENTLTEVLAQEIIDCFWVKMDEKVLLNNRHMNDRLSRGSGAITYRGGDFPQGAALNQWVQQVTVGGTIANDASEPQDACNAVTLMCLKASRRLPLNAPCLSLRLSERTPHKVMEEAAKVVLSGGGHPFMINDDKITKGLELSGKGAKDKSTISLADSRDMVCDGCFESLIAGKNEFAFSYVPVPDAIEMTLNRGRTYAAAGPVHLTGLKASYRSKPATEFEDYEAFYAQFLDHYRYKLIDFYTGMLSRYGNLSKVCPSPLLSPLIDGCIESGRDLTAGGAKYKLLAPLMNGMSCAIDSLWAIKHLVYSDEALLDIDELTNALICDWGYDMKEPFYSAELGDDRIAVQAERFKELRKFALKLPKYGKGQGEIDKFGLAIVRDLVEMAYALFHNPTGPLKAELERVTQQYGSEDNPFEWIITPGIATFEDYAGVGSFLGASADGRRNGQTVASDFSPMPSPSDLPVSEQDFTAETSLKAWALGYPSDTWQGEKGDPIGLGLSNGAPIDMNIEESYPFDDLVELLTEFAAGSIGPNMMSISCADRKTLQQGQEIPERYDLVRMRMGGWSEFFVAMFPHHQEQHKRRPIFTSD